MEKTFFAFGTINYVNIKSDLKQEYKDKLIDEIESICNNLDDLLSAYKPDSDIGRINSNAGRKAVKVDEVTYYLIKHSILLSELSEGAFDITIRPAVDLWQIGKNEQRIPSPNEIKKIQKLINYKDIVVDDKEKTVGLKKKGQSLDLGGIAKGYAEDVIKVFLLDNNVDSALVNFGGSILAIGTKENKKPWNIGIQNPLSKRGEAIGTIELNNEMLVTSGVNERFFIRDGIRYHHILDPRTCAASNSKVLSVTATGCKGIDLDGITTALFVLGVEKGIELAQKMGIEALYLMESGDIIATKAFVDGKYKLKSIEKIY